MSEHILKSLMQLFGIISRINGRDNDERHIVETFLSNRLNLEETDNYLALFEKHAAAGQKRNRISVADSSKMMLICTSINEELTQQQKYSILLHLFILVNADEKVDTQEQEFLQAVADVFNIPNELYQPLEFFSVSTKLDQMENELYLIFNGKRKSGRAQTKHRYTPQLEGYLAFMRVPGQNLFLVKYVGEGFCLLNGQTLEHNKPSTFLIGSVIRGEHLAPIYYADVSSVFLQEQQSLNISFEAKDISYQLQDGRTLMHPISISEANQSLVAIMGPSGAGKSTLMELLNGIKKPTSGQVFINQYDLHRNKEKVEGVIGYVPQDDLLIEELTVYENLFYATKLCYGNYSEEELKKVVDTTLEDLGLHEIAHFQVGSPMQKVISGGERKRVNIGLELLRQPPVMFIDEPTSGLSSNDSLNIMGILKELALKGKVIFTVIHQPSSDIFKLFDKLIILDTGGYPVYYGHPLESLAYFRSRVKQINQEKTVCSECGNVNNEQIFDIIEAKTVNEQGYFTKTRRVTPKQWNDYHKKYKDKIQFKHNTANLKSPQRIAKWLKQFKVFTLRDIKSKLSNQQYMSINLLQAPLLAMLLALLNRYTAGEEYTFRDNENIPVYFFISVITALFMGLVVSAEEIFRDRKILKRERFLNLSRSAYLSSKLMILFSFSAIQTLSFVAIGSLILGIESMFWANWLVLFTVSCFANLLGLNISASFNSAVTIYILIPVLIIPQLVLGGVVIDFDKLNENFRFTDRATPLVGDVMASRWAYEALMVSQFTLNPYNKHFYPYEKAFSQYEYKKLYKLPELRNLLSYLETKADKDKPEAVKAKLTLFRNVFDYETAMHAVDNPLAKIPKTQLPDSLSLKNTEMALYKLERVYDFGINKYSDLKFKAKSELAQSLGSYKDIKKLEARYHNEQVTRIVKNTEAQNRILLLEERFQPKIYSIFMDPRPFYALDYRVPMYYPQKHLAGHYLPTLSFNVLAIWLMTLLLYLSLYFDGLRKLIDYIGSLRQNLFPKNQ